MSFYQNRGIRLPEPVLPRNSAYCAVTKPEAVRLPLVLSAQGRFCAPASRQLEIGTPVARDADGFGIYSPYSGVLGDLSRIRHPLAGEVPAAEVLVDTCVVPPRTDAPALTRLPEPEEIIAAARTCGIVDETDGRRLDLKLIAMLRGAAQVAVGNACEDQPGSFAALSTLTHYGAQVAQGLRLVQRATGAGEAFVIRFGKRPLPADELPGGLIVHPLGCRYPAFPTQAVCTLTDKPFALLGVQALAALYRAVAFHEPQTGIAAAVSGEIAETPRCVFVPFGTPLGEALRCAGIHYPQISAVVGGSLRGRRMALNLPMTVTVTAIFAQEAMADHRAAPCTQCGACVAACPENLLPIHIMKSGRSGHNRLTRWLDATRCTGCGSCSYVCPAGIDLAYRVQKIAEAQKEEEA